MATPKSVQILRLHELNTVFCFAEIFPLQLTWNSFNLIGNKILTFQTENFLIFPFESHANTIFFSTFCEASKNLFVVSQYRTIHLVCSHKIYLSFLLFFFILSCFTHTYCNAHSSRIYTVEN